MKKKCKGAISIFMIIITLSCFMLGGIFIDATRILAARNKVKVSMESATRSAMSYYDEDLVSEYGLYGVDEKTMNDNFKRYFKNNMLKAEYDGINLFKYTINDNEIALNATESFSESLRRQIKEYSKYRAPVTTTLSVVNKFVDMFNKKNSQVGGMTDAANSAEGLEEQFKSSSDVLKNSTKTIKENLKDQLLTTVKDCGAKIVTDGIKYAEAEATKTIDDSIEDSMNKVDKEIEKMEAELAKLKEKKKKLEVESEKIEAAEEIEYESDEEKEEAEEAMKDAKKTDEEIQKEIDNLEKDIQKVKTGKEKIKNSLDTKNNELQDIIDNWKVADTSLTNAKTKLNQAKQALEDIKKEKGLSKIQSSLASYTKDKTDNENLLNNILLIFESEEVKNDITEYKKALDEENEDKKNELRLKYTESKNDNIIKTFGYYDKIYELDKLIEAENKNIAAANQSIQTEQDNVDYWQSEVDKYEEIVDDYKNDSKSKIKEMEDEIDKLNDLTEPDVLSSVFGEVEESVSDAIEKNKGIFGKLKEICEELPKIMPDSGSDKESSSNEKGIIKLFKEMIEEWGSLFSILTNSEKLVDQCMYIDYIMGNCTYLTSQTSKNHYFNWGEVEYILYGNKSQALSILSTATAIYSMRFCINFIDYFLTFQSEFFSRAAYALSRAATSSLRDLQCMIVAADGDAEGCYISPSAKKIGITIKLTYSDHLRILLLKKLNEDDTGRIVKTIDSTLQAKDLDDDESIEVLNYTENLKTGAKAKVRVGVNLIMIPMFTDILPMDKYFDNGQYFIEDSFNFSY